MTGRGSDTIIFKGHNGKYLSRFQENDILSRETGMSFIQQNKKLFWYWKVEIWMTDKGNTTVLHPWERMRMVDCNYSQMSFKGVFKTLFSAVNFFRESSMLDVWYGSKYASGICYSGRNSFADWQFQYLKNVIMFTIVTRNTILDISGILYPPLKVTIATTIIIRKYYKQMEFLTRTNFARN